VVAGGPEAVETYRRDWLERGAPWFSPLRRPPGWDADAQLAAAGLVPGPLEGSARVVATALAELLRDAVPGDDLDIDVGSDAGPGTPRQRLGMGLHHLLEGAMRAAGDWDEPADGLAFLRFRRRGDHGLEVVAMWHVGAWDRSASAPWLVPVLLTLDRDPAAYTVRFEARVGERDPGTGALIRYPRSSRETSHRTVTVLGDLDTIDWWSKVGWPTAPA
jgi:hypothetical protein